MDGEQRHVSRAGRKPLPARRALISAARRVLWELIRNRTRALATTRSALRRRLGDFLRRSHAGKLAAILRSAALAGAVAAALAAPSWARAQAIEFAPIELADVARGEGGFVARGEGQPASGAGGSVSDAGDVNGDGIPDLIVGATPTYVVFGKLGGAPIELSDVLAGRGGFAIHGVAAYDRLGSSVSGAGDLNGDGLADLLVGAPGASPGGRDRAGESYVVFGKPDGAPVELSEVEAGRGGFAIRGIAGEGLGFSVQGAGDVNGDGVPDLIVAGTGSCEYYVCTSKPSYVIFGKPDGAPVELSEVEAGRGGFAIRGSLTGRRVSGAGDVSGDGLADILIGAPGAGPVDRRFAGESYVVFGKPDGAAVELSEVQAGRGGFAIRGSAAYDRSGWSVSGAGDVNGDGLADLLVGAPGADPGGRIRAGESYVVFGKPGGAAVELAEVQAGQGGFAIRGSAAVDQSGSSVSGAGDVNGDGLADLFVGAPEADPGGRDQSGESYVVFGKADGAAVELSEVQAGRGGFAIRGSAAFAFRSLSVSGAGDVNGDGLADLLVGASQASPGGRGNAGESYVVFGKPGGAAVELPEVQTGRGGFAIRGSAAGGYSGSSVSGAGDLNGDGLTDLLLGVPGADPGGRIRAGESYVVFGKPDGAAVELTEVGAGRGGFAIRGSTAGDQSGSSVSGAGDVNGDGIADLLVGARYASPGGRDFAGESYVVFGKPDGVAVELSEVEAGRGGFAIRGSAEGGYSGSSVSGAGDLNGDGLADLLVGAPGANPGGRARAGESYVVFGKPDGTAVELSGVQASRGGFAIRGIAGEGSGSIVRGAGDVNGDGLADLLVGAPLADPGGRHYAGESYVVFGKPGGAPVELSQVRAGRGGFAIRGSAEGEGLGLSVSRSGDVNGDGLADLLVGAPNASPGGRGDAGESYVVFGKPGGAPVELSEVEAGRGGFAIRGIAAGDISGSSVSGASDVNGDGLADLLVGAGLADARYPSLSGAAYVVFGREDVVVGFRRGAVRGEEPLDISDAIRLLGYLFLGDAEPPCLDAADADDSGALDITDAVRVLGYLFLGAAAPPAPGPTTCGRDPTPDDLGCATAPPACR